MFPNGPLIGSIEHSNVVVGDEVTRPEHALQIRIDDVPLDQIEIRNVYAADVIYHGAIPPQNPPASCFAEAHRVHDAQAKLDEVRRERFELAMDLGDLTGKALEERKSQIAFIDNSLIPLRKSDLSTAKFLYGECANIGFRRRIPIDRPPQTEAELNCESFEKIVHTAGVVVNKWEKKVNNLSTQMGMTHSERIRERLMKQIEDIEDNQLAPSKERLAAAKTALDICRENLPSDLA